MLGGGTMGRGIAHVAPSPATARTSSTSSDDVLDSARRTRSSKNLDKGVALGKVEADDAEAALDRLALAHRPRGRGRATPTW